jgi:hypothetical protein
MDDTTEARTGAVLRDNKGVAFCDGCLALKVGVSLETMQTVIGTLERFPGYRVSQQRCSACQRVKLVIRAAADRPRRR